ncbi:LemA family protein [uncultured Paracoccus sp.]|uniref:LemA family protein n=1 Tax=uncultured Paracoccus sp. TaxID=189685 RepID=UPI0026042885|nr:LemA family protein [uncultured Paracoccus sp.]
MGWSWLVVVLVLVVGAGLYVILAYNGLVAARQRTGEAWSGIDVQLKRRSNLVPNLVEVVKGYAAHETEVLQQVTQTRARVEGKGDSVGERAAAEARLGGALAGLVALAENYPDLKASQNFRDLHASLDEIERDIQHARRYYNGAVRVLNTKVQSFPSKLVAARFGFGLAEYFELDSPAERQVPGVSF